MGNPRFSVIRQWYSALWAAIILFIFLGLSLSGCGKEASPSMRDAGIKQLVNQYFDALDTGNIEEYLNLFSPSDRAQMEPILRKIGNLEMADWAGLKKKYGWLFTEKDRRLDMEICSVEAGTPTGDQVRSFEPEAKVWKITFCYYNGSQMREHRSHILVRKKEGFFLYLPLDMEARVYNRLTDLRAFCTEIEKKVDSFRQSMEAKFSSPAQEHVTEMQHIRYPLYIESIGSGNYGCMLSLGAPEAVVHPSISIGIEILNDIHSVAEQLLLIDAIDKDERLESPAAFSVRTGLSPLFSHLGKGVTLNAGYQYTPLVFSKAISRESPSVILLRALDPSEPQDAKAKSFLSTIEAIAKTITIHSAVRYHLDSRRVGVYVSQSGKSKDAFELDLKAELIDVSDLKVRRNASFHAFPPSFRSLSTRFRSSYDMVYDDFRDWLMSLN